ncbi:MAG: cytochrome c [Enterobacteriaceae bacterium]|jgi:D-sorbitol dehydrogenase (acceptor)|nr:cytochrome c [Enterobacteriaceae bacterium]
MKAIIKRGGFMLRLTLLNALFFTVLGYAATESNVNLNNVNLNHADLNSADLIKQGEYVARAADCIACHRTAESDGADFAGGYGIASPMGTIIASNITPSRHYGIGEYSEKQFADAVRKGINKDGKYLYPAMPYTAYQGINDEDMHALYIYLQQGVKPVEQAVPETKLSFPYNIRQLMFGWNMLFLNNSKPLPVTMPEQIQRGKYLVDNLAHCGTCHTPRNILMAEDNAKYLGGADLSGWIAPNITSDPISGIGGWHEQDIAAFLKTGHLANKAQAAGGMAEAVENSFRFLSDQDLSAMAAYLKTVPAIRDVKQSAPAYSASEEKVDMDMSTLEVGQGDQASLADAKTTDGAVLYNSACASCHGRDGQGTADHFYPSLTQNSTVGSPQPNNLVMVIANGLQRKGADADVSMPAFNHQLSNEQIAAVANYVTKTFGHQASALTASDVATLRDGGKKPLLLVATPYLMGLVVIILLAIVVLLFKRGKKRR